jgi:hypothetical protein
MLLNGVSKIFPHRASETWIPRGRSCIFIEFLTYHEDEQTTTEIDSMSFLLLLMITTFFIFAYVWCNET